MSLLSHTFFSQALIVAPSQELAMQIVRVAQGLLPHQGRVMVQQCIGGANPARQQVRLMFQVCIVIDVVQ